MKTIYEITLTPNEFDSLCFLVNYDNKYNTFLSTKEDTEMYLKNFVDSEIEADYVLFRKVS